MIFLALVLATGCATLSSKPKLPVYANSHFYDAEGKFDVDAAKDACIELMQYHGYPVFEGMHDNLWVSDIGAGEFAELGFGAVVFLNHEGEHVGDRYMMLDIFLLPNQMLPEHLHVETEKARPKMEGWLVRHGHSIVVGEGEPTEGLPEMVPESQRASIQAWHATHVKPGSVSGLNRPNAPHWQLAGPDGAIVTEAANFHDGAAIRFTNPKLTLE
jgi:D-lyxose ketol-isomerase